MIRVQFFRHLIWSLCHALEVGDAGASTGATVEAAERLIAASPAPVVDELRLLQRNSGPQDKISARIAAAAKEIEVLHSEWNSSVACELELRRAFLEELWSTKGPGLLRSVFKTVRDPNWVNNERSCEVHLVLPLLGSGATSTPLTGRWFEAVLTDISEVFPELLRVGSLWTDAQFRSSRILA